MMLNIEQYSFNYLKNYLEKLRHNNFDISYDLISKTNLINEIERIGYTFEEKLGRNERKDKGQFYTPGEVVDYIINYLKIDNNSSILDPACGCGSFLVFVAEYLKNKGVKNPLKNIYGVDLNENSVILTKICLAYKMDLSPEYRIFLENNIHYGNSIIENSILDHNAFKWSDKFTNVLNRGGFDFIIGNPPYVTLTKMKDYDPDESIFKNIIHGPVNAATLMIGKSLELLRTGGILAFVLPRTILYVNSYSKLRNYLIENFKIIHIFDLGQKFKNVRGEQIILILKKEKPTKDHRINVKKNINNSINLNKQPEILISNNFFKLFNKFLIFSNPKIYRILEKMKTRDVLLEKYTSSMIFRGITVKSEFINKKNDLSKMEIILRGKSISKFNIKDYYTIDKKLLTSLNTTRIQQLKKKKIVIQNIFSSESGIIAAFDEKERLTLDTVTNIVVEELRGKYLLAILNSKLINFFIIYGLFNGSKLTMHTDRSYLGKIPIIDNPDNEIFYKLIKLSNQAMNLKEIDEKKKILREIDEIVYDLYCINEEEEQLINYELSQIISKKSWW